MHAVNTLIYRLGIPKSKGTDMASIGNRYEYPEYTFTECLGWIEKVGRENIKTFDTFTSSVLGHKNPRSGGVNTKMGTLNKYFGVLEKQGSEVRLTPLGERIVFALGDQPRAEAQREAVMRVALFKDLYSRLGTEYNQKDFRPVLQGLTGVKPQEILQRADLIEVIYRDAARYLQLPFAGIPGTEQVGTQLDVGNLASPSTPAPSRAPKLGQGFNPEEYHVYQTGSEDTFVRVKKDEHVLETVQGMIGIWLEQEKKRAKPNGASGGG